MKKYEYDSKEGYGLLEAYGQDLKRRGASQNTIRTYQSSVRLFYSLYQQADTENLKRYRDYLLRSFSPATANCRICGLNQYLEFLAKNQSEISRYRLATIKNFKNPFLDSIISNEDYNRLKEGLKRDQNWTGYFLVRILACTGVRVSELVQIKAEHLRVGCLDLCSKGRKVRRIYFPKDLQKEAIQWLDSAGVSGGFLFANPHGLPLTTRSINRMLHLMARRYQVPAHTVHPHAFRHLFAKNFLREYNDITLLADLLGHSSIKTTRIYLTKSTLEQREDIDRIVTW